MGIEKIRKKLLDGFFSNKKEQKEPKNLPRIKKINKIQKSYQSERSNEERKSSNKTQVKLKKKGSVETK